MIARREGMQMMLSLSQAFLTINSVQRGLGGGRKTPSAALEIFFGISVRSGFQQRAVQAALGENRRGHATARAGADDANIILLWRTNDLGHAKPSPYKLFFLSSETAKSQARAVKAMYVSDGLTQEEETMQAPSVRNKFFPSSA